MMDEGKDEIAPLVCLSPPDALEFKIERNKKSIKSSTAILRITNISNSKVAFKVKTTQPSLYYVRPNQQVVDVGKTEQVDIIIVDEEMSKILDKRTEKMEKHRFLVQCTNIESRDFDYIKSDITQIERSKQYLRIWESKEKRSNLRLKVKFKMEPPNINYENDIGKGIQNDIGKGIYKLDNKLQQNNGDNMQQSPTNNEKEKYSSSDNTEYIIDELKALQIKFDQVVEYTVHLTNERDNIVIELEKYKRESAIKKSSESVRGIHNENDGNMKDKISNADKKIGHEGFPIYMIIGISILSYLIGRFLM